MAALISCENCHTKFKIDGSLIGENGRFVRCSQCGHEWLTYANDIKDKSDDDQSEEVDNRPIQKMHKGLDQKINENLNQAFQQDINKTTKDTKKQNQHFGGFFAMIFLLLDIGLLVCTFGIYNVNNLSNNVLRFYENIGIYKYDSSFKIVSVNFEEEDENTIAMKVDISNTFSVPSLIRNASIIGYNNENKKIFSYEYVISSIVDADSSVNLRFLFPYAEDIEFII